MARQGKRKRIPVVKRSAAWVWLATGLFVMIPFAWWATRPVERQIKLFAVCDEISTSQATTLLGTSAKRIEAFGVNAEFRRVSEVFFEPSGDGTSVPHSGNPITLIQRSGVSASAVMVGVEPPTGPLFAWMAAKAALRWKSADGQEILEIAPQDLTLDFEAEALKIDADRIASSISDIRDRVSFTVSNKNMMVKLQLRRAPGQSSTIRAFFDTSMMLKLKVESEPNTLFLRQCRHFDVSLDGEKVPIPAMAMVDVESKWTSITVNQFALRTDVFKDAKGLFIDASGLGLSVSYGGRELSGTRLKDLLALSVEKQTLLGVLLLLLTYLGKQLADRISKILLNHMLPEK